MPDHRVNMQSVDLTESDARIHALIDVDYCDDGVRPRWVIDAGLPAIDILTPKEGFLPTVGVERHMKASTCGLTRANGLHCIP